MLPLPTIRSTRCPRSKAMCSMLVSHASLTRRPFNPSSTAKAAWAWSESLCGEQEPTELSSVKPSTLRRMHGGAAHVLGWVGADPTVNVSEPVETARGGQAAVDRRSGQATLLHRTAVKLEMSPLRFEHSQVVISSPLEEVAKIVTVGVQGAAAVAGQKRDRCQLGRIDGEPGSWTLEVRGDGCHWSSSLW